MKCLTWCRSQILMYKIGVQIRMLTSEIVLQQKCTSFYALVPLIKGDRNNPQSTGQNSGFWEFYSKDTTVSMP